MITLTVDIEDWYHIPSVTGSPFSKFKDVDEFFREWKGRYDYLTDPTKRVLDLLDEYNLKATFFIVADITEHYPGLVEQISGRGHEIACHGLHHACKIHPKTKQPLILQEEFEVRTYRAKQILEKASNQEIIGYRAPNAYIAGWMIDSLKKLGFKYDSSVSVNSLYNKSDSLLRNVDTRPYYPARGTLEPGSSNNGILEIPWPYFQFIAKFPTAGGPALRLLGSRYIQLGLKQSLKRGNTMFYFHPIDICREKFPGDFSWKRPFYWMVKGMAVEKRVKQILSSIGSDIITCKQLISEKVLIRGN
jgi:peptidoglycan/xylan/chitin deacetylase (PgdA/CDA1 family)